MPEPLSVNVPLLKLALPATPTAPISLSNQPGAKALAASTVKPMLYELTTAPDVPVTASVTVPVAATLLAINVRVLEVLAGFGLNTAVTPLGSPDTDNVTFPVNPF